MIHELSESILVEISAVLREIDSGATVRFIEALNRARRIFVLGSGRSALIGSAFAMRLMHLGIETHVIGEVTSPDPEEEDLLLVISGSGETETIYNLVSQAARKKMAIWCITTNPDSRIAAKSAEVIVVPAKSKYGAGDSVQPLGSTFEQAVLIFLDALIVFIMSELKKGKEELEKRHTKME